METLIKTLRTKSPSLIYLLDPVMGDMDRGMYVSPDVLPIYRRMLPLATIITPNQYEAQVLADEEITTLASLHSVLRTLHEEYNVPSVVITSLDLDDHALGALGIGREMPDGTPAMLLVGSSWDASTRTSRAWYLQFPSLGEYFSGVGDLFAALTLARFSERATDLPPPARASCTEYHGDKDACTLPVAQAVTLAVASLQQVLLRTQEAMTALGNKDGLDPLQPSHLAAVDDRVRIMRMRELRIIQSAEALLHPIVLHHPRWLPSAP